MSAPARGRPAAGRTRPGRRSPRLSRGAPAPSRQGCAVARPVRRAPRGPRWRPGRRTVRVTEAASSVPGWAKSRCTGCSRSRPRSPGPGRRPAARGPSPWRGDAGRRSLIRRAIPSSGRMSSRLRPAATGTCGTSGVATRSARPPAGPHAVLRDSQDPTARPMATMARPSPASASGERSSAVTGVGCHTRPVRLQRHAGRRVAPRPRGRLRASVPQRPGRRRPRPRDRWRLPARRGHPVRPGSRSRHQRRSRCRPPTAEATTIAPAAIASMATSPSGSR